MRLTHVRLADFRNYRELEIEPAAGLNVFVGANAQGKSNLLEAIAMLGTGKSFRTNRDADVVRYGAEVATIAGEGVASAPERCDLACTVAKGPRRQRAKPTRSTAGRCATRLSWATCAS